MSSGACSYFSVFCCNFNFNIFYKFSRNFNFYPNLAIFSIAQCICFIGQYANKLKRCELVNTQLTCFNHLKWKNVLRQMSSGDCKENWLMIFKKIF